jgi:ACS family tartrate transporter-like MFS transporter
MKERTLISTPMGPLYRKIALRLVPFLMLLYMVAFLDRVNISFAALTMNRDLGISETLYGFAAGIFFFGYCLFEVPANLMLARIGARRWIAFLLIAWGTTSVATAFVANRPEYVAARFLLGVAESGFFPGVIFYLTLWLPRPIRARIMALFLLAVPLCSCVGSPISSHILLMEHVSGLKGWQWLFILEGAPAIILGAISWFVLADSPQSAKWVSAGEETQLASELRADEEIQRSDTGNVWLQVARDSVVYFMYSVGLYGLTFWLPKVLVTAGTTTSATGWWAAMAYGVGAVNMVLVSRSRNKGWLSAMFLIASAGFGCAGLFHGVAGALIGLSFASVGLFGGLPLFWSAATSRMSGKATGAAIAIINSVGAIGGFTGPAAMGWLRDATHTFSAGLWTIAACLCVGAFLAQGASPNPTPAAQ